MEYDIESLETRLRSHVEVLARHPRSRGAEYHDVAAAYIAEALVGAGYATQSVRYHSGSVTCTNIITDPFPEDESLPLLVIGAHYDSMEMVPGADDNASAVAALLELARWIRPQSLRMSGARLQLVAYDLEEYGHIGSFEHSRELQNSGATVRGMISLEMLGYADYRAGSQGTPAALAGILPSRADFICVCGNQNSSGLVGRVAEAMAKVETLPVVPLVVPGNGESVPEARRSDHSEFWDCGFPALMITDTSFFRNPNYHRPSDTPETLDYRFLTRVTLGLCHVVHELLSRP